MVPINKRFSKPRRVLLSELRMTRAHPTAEELYGRVRRRLPRVSLGTVYRNLEVLRGMELVRRVDGGASARYDGDLFDHDHLVCEACGRIEDVPSAVPPSLRGRLETERGFHVRYVRAEFRGLCAACAVAPA